MPDPESKLGNLARQARKSGGDCQDRDRRMGVTERGRSMFRAQRGSGQYQRTEVCGQRKGTHNLHI